jgi:hypothetical protein
MRLFNTAQRSYWESMGIYVSSNELVGSGLLPYLVQTPFARITGMGPRFYSQLDVESVEVIPGWHLQLFPSEDGASYLLTLRARTADETELNAFASDENGVIYEGFVSKDLEWPQHFVPLDEIRPGLAALGSTEAENRWSGLRYSLQRLALFTMAIPQGCCGGSCSCSASCSSSAGAQPCFNMGCAGGCTWCCYSNCGGCAVLHDGWQHCTNCAPPR